jgi:hypothetical protein
MRFGIAGGLLPQADHRVTVKPFERKQLLERVEREGATVGHTIPEELRLQGESLRLREFVFETKRVDSVDPTEQDRVEEVVKLLRYERRERKQRLEEEAMPRDEGERIANEILGIDRAINALTSLEPTDVQAESEQAERADRKRWVTFLKRALGQDDGGTRRAGR